MLTPLTLVTPSLCVQDTEQWGEQDVYTVVSVAGHRAGMQGGQDLGWLFLSRAQVGASPSLVVPNPCSY